MRLRFSPRTRFKLFRRDGFWCQYCGRTAEQTELEINHIIPISKGGLDDFDNLITSCKDCNIGKSTEPVVTPYIELNSLTKEADITDNEIKNLELYGVDTHSQIRYKKIPKSKTPKIITSRKHGGTCTIASKLYFEAGKRYIVSSPDPTILKIQKLGIGNVINTTFSKPKIITARKDRRTVTLAVGKFLNVGEKVQLSSSIAGEYAFLILGRNASMNTISST